MKPSENTTDATLKSDSAGSTPTGLAPATTSPTTSTSCVSPSVDSKPPYRRPKTVGALASQATDVATRVLNGEINLDVAKTYSAILRGVSQLTTARVTQARARKQVPDLSLDEDA